MPEALSGKVFRGQDAIKAGLATPESLRGSGWHRLFRGIYADATVEVTHRLRCVAAAAFLLPPSGVFAGRSALTLIGPGLASEADPVEVLVPPEERFGPVNGVRIHTGTVPANRIRRSGTLRLTNPLQTCWHLTQWLDVVEAVVLLDRALAAGVVIEPELLKLSADQRGGRGSRRFDRAVSLADPAAESPPESRLRVRLLLAGLPRPEVNYRVFGDRGFVARVDLAWPGLRIAVEYDGLWHVGSAARMHQDRGRLNRLVSEGWLVLHVTSYRLRNDFDGVVAEIWAAIRSRSAR